MAEHEHDEEIGRRYRELPREEPPRTLDEAILAAARRELETRPAPLVAPTGRRRWMFPVAAAAVVVLSAVITLHIQREQPDLELATAPPPSAPSAARQDEKASALPPAEMQAERRVKGVERRTAREAEQARPRREQPRASGPSAAREAPKEGVAPSPVLADSAQPKAAEEPRRFAPDPAPPAAAPQMVQPRALAAAPASRPARELDATQAPRDALSQRADASLAKAEIAGESPEKMLERIATLRREGRRKEADDLYAEFRKRFPDYRIPEAMREQVLPR